MLLRFLKYATILCIVGIFTLIFGEFFVRIVRPISTVEYRIDSDLGELLVPNQRTRWVNEDVDVSIFTNSAGFHDVEHALKKPNNVYRIVVLGDSFVEGLQVPIEDCFTQVLEQYLVDGIGSKRVEVINMGISGTGPAQYYHLLKMKGLTYKPDLVLMAVLPDNDFRDSYPDLSGAVTKPFYLLNSDETLRYVPPQASGFGLTLKSFLRKSALMVLFRQSIASLSIENWLARLGLLAPASGLKPTPALKKTTSSMIPLDWYVYLADPPAPWPKAYEVTLRMIRESKYLAARHGAEFVVMLIGTVANVEDRWGEALRNYPGAEELQWDFDRPFRTIKELGKQSGFEVINPVELFKKDFQTHGISHSWPHDGHWNPRGHRLAAEIATSYLSKNMY